MPMPAPEQEIMALHTQLMELEQASATQDEIARVERKLQRAQAVADARARAEEERNQAQEERDEFMEGL